MTSRPKIRADVAATLTAAIPPRLVKKLDADPTIADKWTWSASTITTDKGETITLALDGIVVSGVNCSCLLAPKCLHESRTRLWHDPSAGHQPWCLRHAFLCQRFVPATRGKALFLADIGRVHPFVRSLFVPRNSGLASLLDR